MQYPSCRMIVTPWCRWRRGRSQMFRRYFKFLLHHASCVVTNQEFTCAEASISALLAIGPRLFVSSPDVCRHHRLQDEALLLTVVVGRQRSSLSETPRPAHPIQLRLRRISVFSRETIDRLRVHSRLTPTCIASGHRFLISNRSRSYIVGIVTTSRSFSFLRGFVSSPVFVLAYWFSWCHVTGQLCSAVCFSQRMSLNFFPKSYVLDQLLIFFAVFVVFPHQSLPWFPKGKA